MNDASLFTMSLKIKLKYFFAVVFLVSCSQKQPGNKISEQELKEHFVNANKIMVKNESEEIDDFIKRHQWQMQTTGSGLKYEIYFKGKGPAAKKEQMHLLYYKLYLLDGTLIHASETNKPLNFSSGKAEVPKGLEEGVLLMHVGDKARFVIPSHLGYGVAGDGNKIPGNASLFYDVELVH